MNLHPGTALKACLVSTIALAVLYANAAEADKGALTFSIPQKVSFRFGGTMGDRIQANLQNWLLSAPDANPGMIEIFHRRDRQPEPSLVPWAGEFAGKYLISAVQARRMTDDPRLDPLLRRFVRELIDAQAEDGYLGPFKKADRLMGNWDLWGHYHCMLGLMMWQEDTGDNAARDCVLRAADCICNAYLDPGKKILDMGSHEMNMAVIHVFGRLYRATGDERYLRMMRKIEKEWEESGDYFRAGLQGIDYYKTPRPRWESLHDVQGILELYRITGNEDYKKSFENIWRSIARFDRHNTGGFSTYEQAIGDPYTPGAIETCCTIAWAALTLDMLLLTGDSTVADELEWSIWNSILGAQHPSGRWSTYDTPMDGLRQASAHSIVFQARAGTPELNCCSVNSPRGWGMLSEWAFLVDEDGLIVNYYGPVKADLVLQNDLSVQIEEETSYPADGRIVLRIDPAQIAEFALRLRIPHWSKNTRVSVNGKAIDGIKSGRYLVIQRTWQAGDRVELNLDFSFRTWIGDGHALGKASVYYGPLLLAFDSHYNAFDTDAIPAIDAQNLSLIKKETGDETFQPIVLFQYTGDDGRAAILCDFATAGAYGTPYVTWLPAVHTPPPPILMKQPGHGETVPAGPIKFEWSGAKGKDDRVYTLAISKDRDMKEPVVRMEGLRFPCQIVNAILETDTPYYWRVESHNSFGEQTATDAPYSFTVDATRKNPLAVFADNPALLVPREDGLLTASPLDGEGTPTYGCLVEAKNVEPVSDRFGNEKGAVRFSGNGILRYAIPYFPADEYTFLVWIYPESRPTEQLSQIVSTWARGGDDPLRIVFENDSLFARIEGFTGVNTPGIAIPYRQWTHAAAVKMGNQLAVYINGKLVASTSAPVYLPTVAADFALGANPHFSGNEYFWGCLDDFAFYAKGMSAEEIGKIYTQSKP